MKRPEVMDEETYTLSLKGCAYAAMKESGLIEKEDDVRFQTFWNSFDSLIKNLGYVDEEEELCD